MCKLFITCIDGQPMLNQDLKAGPPSIVQVEVLPHVNPQSNLRYAIAKPHLDYHGHIVARHDFRSYSENPCLSLATCTSLMVFSSQFYKGNGNLRVSGRLKQKVAGTRNNIQGTRGRE